MKSFKQFILEVELTDKQKKMVKQLTGSKINDENLPSRKISGHLPFVNDRLEVPLESSSELTNQEFVSSDIHNHLQSKGFTPISRTHAEKEISVTIPKTANHPQAGQTIKKKQQQRIGALLSDNPALQKEYAKTEAQKGIKTDSNQLKVVIGRNPHDICTKSTGWGATSCMRLPNPDTPATNSKTGEIIYDPKTGKPKSDPGGSNYKFLSNDIKQGSHEAYLVHKDDTDIKAPISRISLKPFVAPSGRTILRAPRNPDGSIKQYGQGNKDFEHTITKWENEKFPMHSEDHSYTIADGVYDDSNLNNPNIRSRLINSNLSSEAIHHIIKHDNPEVVKSMLHFPALTKEHVNEMRKHPDKSVQLAAIKHPLTTKEDLEPMMKTMDFRKHEAVMQNPNATPEMLRQGLNHRISPDARIYAVKHKNTAIEDLQQVVNDPKTHPRVKEEAKKRLKLKEIARKVLALRNN